MDTSRFDKTIAYEAEASTPGKVALLTSRLSRLASHGVGLILLLSWPENDEGLAELIRKAKGLGVGVVLDLSKDDSPRSAELAKRYLGYGALGFRIDSSIDAEKFRLGLASGDGCLLIGTGKAHRFDEAKSLLEKGFDMIYDEGGKDLASVSALKEYLTQWQYHVDWNAVHLESCAAFRRVKKSERFSTMLGTLLTSLKGMPFIPESWTDEKTYSEASIKYLEAMYGLRNAVDALKYGYFCPIVAQKEVMAFYRVLGGVMILCIINLDKNATKLPEQASRVEGEVLASNYGRKHYDPKGKLKPYEAMIIKIN